MGKDGAAGMVEMKTAGAHNFAQDEASCVVFGMPREAIALGGTHEVAALQDLPGLVLGYLATHGARALRV
jgi:two-component system, chemotaxis family, protein-glutamate methylesterase/glutaminase